MMPRKSIPIGTRFGMLTVIGVGPITNHRSTSIVKCDCGKTRTLPNCALLLWGYKSCGCQVGTNLKKHGESKTRLFKIWANMIERCTTDKPRYKNYHGRGIRVCEKWIRDYTAFRDWALANGYANSLSIDRIDVNGNYEPSNCRWVSMEEQMQNRTTNVFITAHGTTLTIAEWARKTGINEGTLRTRISRLHWSPERALSTKQTKENEKCK